MCPWPRLRRASLSRQPPAVTCCLQREASPDSKLRLSPRELGLNGMQLGLWKAPGPYSAGALSQELSPVMTAMTFQASVPLHSFLMVSTLETVCVPPLPHHAPRQWFSERGPWACNTGMWGWDSAVTLPVILMCAQVWGPPLGLLIGTHFPMWCWSLIVSLRTKTQEITYVMRMVFLCLEYPLPVFQIPTKLMSKDPSQMQLELIWLNLKPCTCQGWQTRIQSPSLLT